MIIGDTDLSDVLIENPFVNSAIIGLSNGQIVIFCLETTEPLISWNITRDSWNMESLISDH